MNSTPEDYLELLRRQLVDLPKDEQEEILAEIEAHIDEGLADRDMGVDSSTRLKSLMNEMGSPKIMGEKIRRLYRPNKWPDFLLAVIPTLMVMPLLAFLVTRFVSNDSPLVYLGLERLAVAFVMTILASYRQSTYLLLFWATTLLSIGSRSALFTSEALVGEQVAIAGGDYWFVGLAGFVALVFWFGRFLLTIRHDRLLLALALLPIIKLFTTLPIQMHLARLVPAQQFRQAALANAIANFPIMLLVLSLIFLTYRRRYVWMGLFLWVLLPLIAPMFVFQATLLHPVPIIAWCIPILIMAVLVQQDFWQWRQTKPKFA